MSHKNKHRRRSKNKASRSQNAINSTVHLDAGGIDVGAEELVVAIPPGRDPTGCVRTFSAFTSGVEALRDWLLANRVRTVAMESTGNYWITAYDVLEQAGIELKAAPVGVKLADVA